MTQSRWRPLCVVLLDGEPNFSGARDFLSASLSLASLCWFLAPVSLFLGELALPAQGHQDSKKTKAETKSRIQTFPKVVQTKIKE